MERQPRLRQLLPHHPVVVWTTTVGLDTMALGTTLARGLQDTGTKLTFAFRIPFSVLNAPRRAVNVKRAGGSLLLLDALSSRAPSNRKIESMSCFVSKNSSDPAIEIIIIT